jgi:hypothetical protein
VLVPVDHFPALIDFGGGASEASGIMCNARAIHHHHFHG